MKNKYQTGICNIGPQGRLKRFLSGVIALTLGFAIWLLFKSHAALYLLSIIGFIGLIQARISFCIANGLKNTADLDKGEKQLLQIEATKNRVQAVKILIISIIAGVIFSFIISNLIK